MTRVLDALATHPWYVDHIGPVWAALPEQLRGEFHTSKKSYARARETRVDRVVLGPLSSGGRPVLVAASGDMFSARRARRQVILMEHGAGQSYGGGTGPGADQAGRHSSYAGGDSRDSVALFLHPGPHPAARDAARYPKARVEVVGSPRLDRLPAREPRDGPPVVALSFHWDCNVAPETRSSFIWARNHLVALARDPRVEVLGHGHPRIFDRLLPWYQRKGIEATPSFDEVLRRADLLVCDNSSAIFEFASTGRHVVVLDPPFYRPEVEHGLRFWAAADVGLRVAEPYFIRETVLRALEDLPEQKEARERALDLVYGYRNGAAERAARVIRDWLVTR